MNREAARCGVQGISPDVVPMFAVTETHRHGVAPMIFDCVRLVTLREGTMLLDGYSTRRAARPGDQLLIAPGAPLGYEPEGTVTLTTIYLDTDYLIEQLFWQHLGEIPDRDAARDLATTLYPDAVQIAHLTEDDVGRLSPMLDRLSNAADTARDGGAPYFLTHALLFGVLAAFSSAVRPPKKTLADFVRVRADARLAPPRWRAFRPIRPEIAHTAALMQADIAHSWTLSELAKYAHLGASQFGRVFSASFGVTPTIYLAILRAQRMARLIRETTLPIGILYREVGWKSRGQASEMFRRYMGTTPTEYRRCGPPCASPDGMRIARP